MEIETHCANLRTIYEQSPKSQAFKTLEQRVLMMMAKERRKMVRFAWNGQKIRAVIQDAKIFFDR